MSETKADKVYKALDWLNRWLYEKYTKDKNIGYLPRYKNAGELKEWVNHNLRVVSKEHIKTVNYFGNGGCYKLKNQFYWEALDLLFYILDNNELTEHDCDIRCYPNDKNYRLIEIETEKELLGTIIVKYGLDCYEVSYIIISVKQGRYDLDITFYNAGI